MMYRYTNFTAIHGLSLKWTFLGGGFCFNKNYTMVKKGVSDRTK